MVIPEPVLSKKVIEVSEKLNELDTYFTLDNENFFVHASIYMLQLNDAGLEKALNLLSIIAQETKKIDGVAKEYHYENNYIDTEYVRSKEFEDLQSVVLEKLNPIRDGLRQRDKEKLIVAVGEERETILKYGYRSVGNAFSPHVTFTCFKDNQEKAIELLPEKDLFKGKFVELGLFEMGENGTCVRKIKTWNLRNTF